MTTFTKEQLIEHITRQLDMYRRLIKAQPLGDNTYNRKTISAMEIALASLTAEPLYGGLLQGSQPVSEPYKLKDAVADIRNSGVEIDADKIKAERDAINSPVIPDGWKLVPIEPTAAMFHAFNDCDYGRKSMRERYIQMIEAAPAQEQK